ncbi:LysR substrate-binding domain-containing protein [Rhodocyclaceae bacterium SMB388]
MAIAQSSAARSAPGAILSAPMLLYMARQHPRLQLEVARGSTDLLVHALRAQRLDAAVVDIRALRPAADLRVTHQVEMSASFVYRKGRPLTETDAPVPFEDLPAYPIASTPLSDEVARILTERDGPLRSRDAGQSRRCARPAHRPRTRRHVPRRLNPSRLAARHDFHRFPADKGRRC